VAWAFLALVLLVGAERRLAEIHFNFRTAALAIESNDALDADEIRIRLVVLNDDRPPTVHVPVGVLEGRSRAFIQACPCVDVIGRPASRAPPAVSSVAA
jgi:hypothetical protein